MSPRTASEDTRERLNRALVRDRVALHVRDWREHLTTQCQSPRQPPQQPQLPDALGPFPWSAIAFGDYVATGSWSDATLHRDGRFEFRGHFHDSGASSCTTQCVRRALRGRPRVHLHAFRRDRRHFLVWLARRRLGCHGNESRIVANWAAPCAGWARHSTVAVNSDWRHLVDTPVAAAKDVLAVAGVVVQVIVVVSEGGLGGARRPGPRESVTYSRRHAESN